eukprot:6969642-Pyramimonas_sp.AAC.1
MHSTEGRRQLGGPASDDAHPLRHWPTGQQPGRAVPLRTLATCSAEGTEKAKRNSLRLVGQHTARPKWRDTEH